MIETIVPSQNAMLDCTGSNLAFFKLPSNMTIETAENIGIEFKSLFHSGQSDLVLDASEVENITTPSLQLIISLEKTLLAAGRALILKGESEALNSAFKDAGLENLLSGRK